MADKIPVTKISPVTDIPLITSDGNIVVFFIITAQIHNHVIAKYVLNPPYLANLQLPHSPSGSDCSLSASLYKHLLANNNRIMIGEKINAPANIRPAKRYFPL